MKPTDNQKEKYFSAMAMHIIDDLNKRIDKFYESYEKREFGNAFFLDIEHRNVLRSLIWYRERMKIHLNLCIANGISKDSFAYEHCGGFYLKRLEDIELKGFMSVLKLKDSYFGLSAAEREKRNKKLERIANEVLEELLAEEKEK